MAPSNPASASPLDEAALLGWIEGNLPAEREGEVRTALAANPALARWLAEMRADRETMLALRAEPAPAGLLEGVEAALERQMLLGLSEGSPMLDGPPSSLVHPSPRGGWRSVGWMRGLAMAAGVAVAIGGAALVTMALRGNGPGQIPSPPPNDELVASTDIPGDNSSPLTLADGPASTGETTVALAPEPELESTSGADGVGTPTDSAFVVAEASDDPALPVADFALKTGAAEDVSGGVPMERAAELAREGRLVIRVRGRDPYRALSRVDDLAARAERGQSNESWRVVGQAGPTLTYALKPVSGPDLFHVLNAPPQDPAEVAMAGAERTAEPQVSPSAWPTSEPIAGSFLPVLSTPDPIFRVYLVEVSTDPMTLRAALDALSAGTGQRATFEEAAAPLLPASDTPPVLAPQAMLWWSQPPSRWAVWASVPVVVEGTRGK